MRSVKSVLAMTVEDFSWEHYKGDLIATYTVTLDGTVIEYQVADADEIFTVMGNYRGDVYWELEGNSLYFTNCVKEFNHHFIESMVIEMSNKACSDFRNFCKYREDKERY